MDLKTKKDDRQEGSTSVVPTKLLPMARTGFGCWGTEMSFVVNHFNVTMPNPKDFFCKYSVSINYKDGNVVEAKSLRMKILDLIYKKYAKELDGEKFSYGTGGKYLFTIGRLKKNKIDFHVHLEQDSENRNPEGRRRGAYDTDNKRLRREPQSTMYKIAIRYALSIPMKDIANSLQPPDYNHLNPVLRVLNTILNNHAARRQRPCLSVRDSLYDPTHVRDLGHGLYGRRAFFYSVRPTQGGLSLNMDVTNTVIIRPGPVIDFLLHHQKVATANRIDWIEAKGTLKSLRVRNDHSNREYKIVGLSVYKCKDLRFNYKNQNGHREEMTVYHYFTKIQNIRLEFKGELPCVIVGKRDVPTYIPVELCSLVSVQRYEKSLSSGDRAARKRNSQQKPSEKRDTLVRERLVSDYSSNDLLKFSRVSISRKLTKVEGRVLEMPELKVGHDERILPNSGRWSLYHKTSALYGPVKIKEWAIVDFSTDWSMEILWKELARCCKTLGIIMQEPRTFTEDVLSNRSPPSIRVDEMMRKIKSRFERMPSFILCILPRQSSDLYGPWKKANLFEYGVITQCVVPNNLNNRCLTNILLKINTKLGGQNWILSVERNIGSSTSRYFVYTDSTLVVGMDVCHTSSYSQKLPSIAAVVGSRKWPYIAQYGSAFRYQASNVEIIRGLFTQISETEDQGMFRELLMDYYENSNGRKPKQIIIFRDGVAESEMERVLNSELDQIMKACKFFNDDTWEPKFMLVVGVKRHRTRIFLEGSCDNVPCGTVVDRDICHPKFNDFYMCAHKSSIGTSRPIHYHILYDELGYSPDHFQEFVYALSYVCGRSTSAISIVAPIYYAHLAAAQVFKTMQSSSSDNGGESCRLKMKNDISKTMFYC